MSEHTTQVKQVETGEEREGTLGLLEGVLASAVEASRCAANRRAFSPTGTPLENAEHHAADLRQRASLKEIEALIERLASMPQDAIDIAHSHLTTRRKPAPANEVLVKALKQIIALAPKPKPDPDVFVRDERHEFDRGVDYGYGNAANIAREALKAGGVA